MSGLFGGGGPSLAQTVQQEYQAVNQANAQNAASNQQAQMAAQQQSAYQQQTNALLSQEQAQTQANVAPTIGAYASTASPGATTGNSGRGNLLGN